MTAADPVQKAAKAASSVIPAVVGGKGGADASAAPSARTKMCMRTG